MKDKEIKLYLECSCLSKDHLVAVQYDVFCWNDGDITRDIYIYSQMDPRQGFFKRAWTALKYMFTGRLCDYGPWGETIVGEKQAKQLQDLL